MSTLSSLWHSPRRRLLGSALIGAVAAVPAGLLAGPAFAAMTGVTVAEVAFLVSSLAAVLPMDAERTRANARREDLRPVADEALVAALCVLAVITMVTLHLGAGGAAVSTIGSVITLVGVFGAWACIQQTYALHYAYRYYLEESGIDFHQDVDQEGADAPTFGDFLYFSYAIGMTYGVTDNDVSDRAIRMIAWRHAVISFAFGTILLAAAVNLVAGFFSPVG